MPTLKARTIRPTEKDRKLAAETSLALEPLSSVTHELRVQILDEGSPNTALALPASAVRMLRDILKEMAKGNAITLVPTDAMLTTQEAAEILNVSRPFLVHLLELGRIPYQRLGSHRRVRFVDLMTFKTKADEGREAAMRQLTEEAQELKLGY